MPIIQYEKSYRLSLIAHPSISRRLKHYLVVLFVSNLITTATLQRALMWLTRKGA